MKYNVKRMSYLTLPIAAAAIFALTSAPSHGRDAKELLLKSVVRRRTFRRSSSKPSSTQRWS